MEKDIQEVSVYHLTKRQRVFYGISFIVFTIGLFYFLYGGIAYLMGISIDGGTHSQCFFPVQIFVNLYFSLQLFHLTFRTRLIISSEGILYKYYGGYIHAKWDEIERIYTQQWIFRKYENLRVKSSALKAKGLLASLYWTEAIPVSLFAHDWQSNALGKEIKRYKPDLFSQNQENLFSK